MAARATKPVQRKTPARQGIAPGLRKRNPLITPKAARLLHDMQEHPDAPNWNYTCGDRITAADLEALGDFRLDQIAARKRAANPGPPAELILRLAAQIPQVEWLRSRIPAGTDLARDWAALPTMAREDFSRDMGYIMPDGCNLQEMYVYDTSGTTGHVLYVPNSARGVSSYLPLLEFAMARHGVRVKFEEGRMGCVLLCAQAKTIAYASVHAAWNNSGYAKINLNPADWPKPGSAARWLKAFHPPVLCGDPVSFAEAMRQKLPLRPRAMISTALTLTTPLRRKLERHFKCPVIDTYSLNETGLISYVCPKGFQHVLPHDIYVETLDPAGRPVAPGERGEIAVSGGRNPFVPLLRYRTGDYAKLDHAACKCGDPLPRLMDLEGRAPVLFRARDGSVVNNVDLSRVLRKYPLVQFRFEQKRGGACELTLRPIEDARGDWHARLADELSALFRGMRIGIQIDARLGDGVKGSKIVPYISAMKLEP